MLAGSCWWGAIGKYQNWTPKLLISGRSGTQYVAMVRKLVYSHCAVDVVESHSKESGNSDSNGLVYFFIIADQNSVEFMTSSLG